jgi:hypothetical protein
VRSREDAEAAAGRDPRDADGAARAAGDGVAARAERLVDRAEIGSRTDRRPRRQRIERHALHRAQIDDDAAVVQRKALVVVTDAAAYGER